MQNEIKRYVDALFKDAPDMPEARALKYVKLNWLLTVCAYFVFSFTTGAWYISWVIFLIGAATAQLIKININEV